jgi:hypothetical protein
VFVRQGRGLFFFFFFLVFSSTFLQWSSLFEARLDCAIQSDPKTKHRRHQLLAGNFNSWDRVPMLHHSDDATGPPTWSPGYSTVSRNLIINSYGAGHGIDHDDGACCTMERVGMIVGVNCWKRLVRVWFNPS